jgi:predicted XRE-type DNA-binding protein
MENRKKIVTLFGKYLKKVNAHQSKIAEAIGIPPKRISLLSTDDNAKPYAEEFYKIIYLANQQAGLGEDSFHKAVDEIFPKRAKVNLLAEFKDLSPEGKFFKKYTQKQTDIEHKLGIANGKISKYFGDKSKRALAVEIIAFADGMGLDVLEVFKEIYGEIKIDKEK